jgi:hypothetical protein
LFALCGLDFDRVRKIRLKSKPHVQQDGTIGNAFPFGRHYWFEPDKLHEMLESKINELQSVRLSDSEKKELARLTAPCLETLGYR